MKVNLTKLVKRIDELEAMVAPRIPILVVGELTEQEMEAARKRAGLPKGAPVQWVRTGVQRGSTTSNLSDGKDDYRGLPLAPDDQVYPVPYGVPGNGLGRQNPPSPSTVCQHSLKDE